MLVVERRRIPRKQKTHGTNTLVPRSTAATYVRTTSTEQVAIDSNFLGGAADHQSLGGPHAMSAHDNQVDAFGRDQSQELFRRMAFGDHAFRGGEHTGERLAKLVQLLLLVLAIGVVLAHPSLGHRFGVRRARFFFQPRRHRAGQQRLDHIGGHDRGIGGPIQACRETHRPVPIGRTIERQQHP